MLLAAVLLGSVSVSAQSNNAPKKVDGETPLEGDINGDGTVDVADMVNIIKIMKDAGGAVGEKQYYWYAGTNGGNAVTADNFTDVASRIHESEIPATNSVTADGQYIYFVIPGTKHLEALVDENGTAVEFTVTDAMGYHIYKTVDVICTTINYTIAQTIYYWYVGQTQPTSLDGLSTINEYTSPIEYTNTSDTRGYVYILLHYSKIVTSVIGKVSGGSATFRIIDDTTIPDYNIWRTAALASGSTFIINLD